MESKGAELIDTEARVIVIRGWVWGCRKIEAKKNKEQREQTENKMAGFSPNLSKILLK